MNQFEIHQIKSTEDQYFADFWEIYSTSFPLNERRISEQQIAVFKKTGYKVNGYLSGDHLVGFIALWTAKTFKFIEHFAVAPEVRSKGFGHIILKQFIEGEVIPVILEIEPPVDDLTNRRLRFYESAGFIKNKHLHFQPPYHTDDSPLQLNILTFPHQITPDLYLQFSIFQINTVMEY
jgi:hypothetical protein